MIIGRKFQMNYSIFVASLSSEFERRDFATKQFQQYGLEPEFIDAVDMRVAKEHEVSAYQSVMKEKGLRALRATEIGCALTHLKIAQEVINRQLDFALITEDDVVFLNNPKVILEAMSDIKPQSNIDVALLGYVKVYPESLPDYCHRLPIKIDVRLAQYQLGRPWKQKQCGAVAYILTQAGAQKIIAANTPVCHVADAWDDFAYTHHIDVKHIRPPIAIESQQFQSTNGNEAHRPVSKSAMSRNFHLWKHRILFMAMNYFGIAPR